MSSQITIWPFSIKKMRKFLNSQMAIQPYTNHLVQPNGNSAIHKSFGSAKWQFSRTQIFWFSQMAIQPYTSHSAVHTQTRVLYNGQPTWKVFSNVFEHTDRTVSDIWFLTRVVLLVEVAPSSADEFGGDLPPHACVIAGTVRPGREVGDVLRTRDRLTNIRISWQKKEILY